MKLLKQMIDKRIKNQDIWLKYSRMAEAYMEHISAYLLALFYLGLSDSNFEKKRMIWKKFAETKDMKYYRMLMNVKIGEDAVILQAINKMDKEKEEQSQNWGSLYDDFSWAILSFQHEQN